MLVDLSINPSKTTNKIVKFIKETVYKAGFQKVILGLSGGIDSAVSVALAVKALGVQNVHIGLFPYGELHKEGLVDAKILIEALNIPLSNLHQINIKPLIDPVIKTDHSQMNNLRKGNIMVRLRMILLYDLAKKYNALVLGTENKTEHLLGYFTRFGDEASDIEPILGLYKTQIRQLAKYLRIPEKIIDKAPTAGLWQGQTDEGEFGFSYEEADRILYLFFDQKKNKEEIFQRGFKAEVVEKVLTRVKENEFKHKLPFII